MIFSVERGTVQSITDQKTEVPNGIMIIGSTYKLFVSQYLTLFESYPQDLSQNAWHIPNLPYQTYQCPDLVHLSTSAPGFKNCIFCV
jgi:hypothetical protein